MELYQEVHSIWISVDSVVCAYYVYYSLHSLT
jgi:hypothetical protein